VTEETPFVSLETHGEDLRVRDGNERRGYRDVIAVDLRATRFETLSFNSFAGEESVIVHPSRRSESSAKLWNR
jgi:hypothetical protein